MGYEDFSRIDLEALCSPVIIERGESYYREGHLIRTCRFEEIIYGRLIGAGSIYLAKLHLGTKSVDWECTCPYPDFCKHLAALALAWLEHPERFVKVDDILAEVVAISGPLEPLRQLVAGNPFSLLELYDTVVDVSESNFISNRGILNLVRNLFSRISFRPDEAVALWERVQNTGMLLHERLEQADTGALEPLIELWTALIDSYQQFKNENLKEVIAWQFQQIPLILEKFDFNDIHGIFELFSRNYGNPLLWELGPDFRKELGRFIEKYPQLIEVFINLSCDQESFLQLAACYELITELPSFLPKQPYLASLQSALNKFPEGKLWLIDRLTANEPDEAYRMAKIGLRTAPAEGKAAFREKLIHVHRIRLEFRQAAALSYLQFCEKPSLEEYLRLKEILITLPRDFQSYHLKITAMLQQEGLEELLIKVLIRSGEENGLAEQISKIVDRYDIVMTLIDDLTAAIRPSLLESGVYPAIIITALDQFNAPTPKKVLRLVAAYKKCCLQSERDDLWKDLISTLEERLGEYPDYRRKLGALL